MTDRIPTVRIPVPRTAGTGTRPRPEPSRWDWLLLSAFWQALAGLGSWWMPWIAVPVETDDYAHDSGWSDMR
ncbi:hypothetical protein [Streptomyces sp. NPDC002676]